MFPSKIFPETIKLATNGCLRFNLFSSRVYRHHFLAVHQNVSVNCFASMHCSPLSKARNFTARNFTDRENVEIHSMMENMHTYRDILKYPAVDDLKSLTFWTSKSTDIFQKFFITSVENVDRNLCLDDSKYHGLVQSVVSNLPKATDDQLLKIFRYLCLWPANPTVSEPMFKLLWISLDRECTVRLKGWSTDFKLRIADSWFHLRLSRITRYNAQMIQDLVKSKDCLSTPQFVQLMFYVNLQRDTPHHLLLLLEDKLSHVVKEITIEELGIVCLGFFKTKNRIVRKSIVKSIILRLISEVSEADSLSLTACLKFLRRSRHGDLTDLYITLLNQTMNRMPKLPVPAVIHAALLSMSINIYMPSLLDVAVNALIDNQSSARAKDGMKLLHCLAHFYHQPKPKFNEFFQNLLCEEGGELESYPRILFYTLLSYAYLGQYPIHLIHKALQPEFVQNCIDINGPEMMDPIAMFDYCLEIEGKDYNGPRVDQSIVRVLRIGKGSVRKQESGRLTVQTRLTSLVFEVLASLYGNCDDLCIKYILPHMFSPDIILRMRSKNQEPLSKCLENASDLCVIKHPPDEVWVCVMICGGYCFSHRSKRLTGINFMKLRQLQKLGYQVLQVPFYEAESRSELTNYLLKHLKILEESNNVYKLKHIS